MSDHSSPSTAYDNSDLDVGAVPGANPDRDDPEPPRSPLEVQDEKQQGSRDSDGEPEFGLRGKSNDGDADYE
ncbi:hypothetical protein RRF57_005913 [Xylaria bambusicola]|uniref:Uncharacterized protein n=1 Tax=Xylaria bambusicola TaxID=326684 RepID=A0AAN7UPI5_9PEZI